MRQKAEKRRRTKRSASTSRTVGKQAEPAVDEAEEAEGPKVARQQVTRQTVRTTEDGRRIVERNQPRQQPRSARKKK